MSSASPYIKEHTRNEEEALPSNSQQPSYHLIIWQTDIHWHNTLLNTQLTDPSGSTTILKSQEH